MAHKEDDELLVSLERGQIPGLICKELGDWVIVDQLWPFLLEVLHEHRLVIGQPRTPDGVWRELQSLREQVAQEPDPAGLHVIDKIQPVIESYLDAVRATRDDNHIQASIATHTAIQVIEHMMLIEMTARGAVMRFIALQVRFKFNVAEKLRELITVHSRRSRYLY